MTDQTRPDISLTANEAAALDEADQQRQRAETAEAEREQAHNALIATRQMANDANAALRDRLLAALGIENDGHTSLAGYVDALTGQLARLHDQLADAHAAGARSATEADQLREQRDRLSGANKVIITENHNVREQLDRANTGRQRLQEQITAQDQLLSDVFVTLQDWLHDTTADGTPIESLLNRLRHGFQQHAASPVRPGSSRPAQEEPGRIDTEWWNRRALISDTLGRALWKRGHVVPLSVRDRCAEAVLAALDADEPQPEQPTKAPWPSAEEAALLWHNTYEKHVHPDARLPWSEVPEPVRAVMIATAEKMLDFLRRRMGGIPTPKLAQGGIVSPGTVSSVIASSNRFARAAAGLPAARDWVSLRTGSGRQYEGERSPACLGDGQPGHQHDIRCVRRDPAPGTTP